MFLALGASLSQRILAVPSPSIPSAAVPSADSSGDKAEHIVILDKSCPHPSAVLDRIGLHTEHADVRHVYNNAAFQGFAANVSTDTVHAMGFMSDVSTVEAAVAVMSTRYRPSDATSAHKHPRRQQQPHQGQGQQHQPPSSDTTASTRPNSPWGLQSISSSTPVRGPAQSLSYTYAYAPASPLGLNVDIYIVDSGLNTAAAAFATRAKTGYSYTADSADYDGHGTHTAGTAAGNTFGIATGANLVGVKVLDADGAGTSSDTIAGMDYVINAHNAHKGANTNQGTGGGGFVASVMSMSWGLASQSSTIDAAITAASTQGIHVVVAAGNHVPRSIGNTDACNVSPSSLGGARSAVISVGSVGQTNQISAFSNTGACVDVYAPGENVVSTWIGGPTVANSLDGTSMSTPHVAGVVAVLASQDAGVAGDVGGMKGRVLTMALGGVVGGDAQGGPAVLLNNGVTGGDGGRRKRGLDLERRDAALGGLPKGYTFVDEGTSIH